MADSHHSTPPHSLEFVPDRGPTKYFHGRKEILSDFSNLLQYASQLTWGTIFLIRDDPGVGKSALLYECGKRAIAREWEVAEIGVDSLWNPNQLLDSLGLADKYELTEKSTQFGFKNLFGSGYRSTRTEPDVEKILRRGNNRCC